MRMFRHCGTVEELLERRRLRRRAGLVGRRRVGAAARRLAVHDLDRGDVPRLREPLVRDVPTVEGLVAQAIAAALVIGSDFLAEHIRVRAPRARAAGQLAASESS